MSLSNKINHLLTHSPIHFFCADLDGTLLGEEKAAKLFKSAWEALPPAQRPLLGYNTGRLLDDVLQLIAQGQLTRPDYIIDGVGTNIFNYRERQVLKAFTEILEEDWDLARVERVLQNLAFPLEKQPDHYQNDYKSSWYLNDARPEQIEQIQSALEDAGVGVRVVYSSFRHLDILPKAANKGNALRWLLQHLAIPVAQTLVAGDSGNDSAMFALKGIRGIVVGNAQPELLEMTKMRSVFHAGPNEVCAYGVLRGLQHHGIPVLQTAEPAPHPDESPPLYEALLASGVEIGGALTPEQLAFIRQGYHQAIDALKKCITPLGFAACSPADNSVEGTDENYLSVWARDGALTVIGSLSLRNQDEAIRQCQRQTLETLLRHLSPNGQFPANVRIQGERPDYSGVGGIASIDSGLWIIIAVHAYLSQTRDLEFLRRHLHSLQMAMDWLSAHDSNNDALLEIPEAGDWTDLFGRSYNVLYDEVLWYQCNICFARLLQMLGHEQQASDYQRWARVIKREIITNFWPTTRKEIYKNISFAEQQYSIGDARYLIAQLTPFDFSWRCDVLGNLLAFLYDVTDDRQAGQTFRFLWGVGANEPFPVANIYPVVNMGDKDWRPYYTVNLLNLPHHYHNGGIWPFVGGHWVRFINKLGLRELALHELYRLAELNKLGVGKEWEFNEWAHGQTGRPMGKAFQAWSASEYIRACHALHVVA